MSARGGGPDLLAPGGRFPRFPSLHAQRAPLPAELSPGPAHEDERACSACKWASPTGDWPMAAVTTLNMGLLDVLLRKRLPRIRSKSPNFERCGTHLWTCTGTMWAPGARPCGERTDGSGTTRGAGRMGSPDHSGQFSWLLSPRRLKFCGSRTRSQRAARSQTGGLCRAAASRDLSSLRREGLWPQHHLATECGL